MHVIDVKDVIDKIVLKVNKENKEYVLDIEQMHTLYSI